MLKFLGQELSCFRGDRLVFSELSFALEEGNVLLLQGPNGSGKSSLLQLMAGLIEPIEGVIRWSDTGSTIEHDLSFHHGRTHYVGHSEAIKPVMTVKENLSFWSRLRTSEPKIPIALRAFGLESIANVPGQFLSAGQKKRLNLARILAAPAKLWLLDEPATALDSHAISSLSEVITTHREKGGIVIASTHQDLGVTDIKTLKLGDFAAEAPAYV